MMPTPATSASSSAGTSGAERLPEHRLRHVPRGTPSAVSAAYARRRATMLSVSATSTPAAATVMPMADRH